NAAQRGEGLVGGTLEPSGFVFSMAGGAASGSIAILGSIFGGTTVERESGIVSGRRSMPGSIREGGVLGARGCSGGKWLGAYGAGVISADTAGESQPAIVNAA